jgi:hypothetical protein
MITINLLPPHLRPVKRSPLPTLLALGVLILAGVWVGLQYLQMQQTLAQARDTLESRRSEYAGYKDTVEQYNELQAEKKRLAVKIATIKEIVSGRIIWSRQLFNISRLRPSNVWYREIKIEQERERVANPNWNSDMPNSEKFIEEVRNYLVLSGYVLPTREEGSTVHPLLYNLQSDPEFSSLFQEAGHSFEDTEFADAVPVREFQLRFEIIAPEPREAGGEAA